jgi:hypothetical protein
VKPPLMARATRARPERVNSHDERRCRRGPRTADVGASWAEDDEYARLTSERALLRFDDASPRRPPGEKGARGPRPRDPQQQHRVQIRGERWRCIPLTVCACVMRVRATLRRFRAANSPGGASVRPCAASLLLKAPEGP